MYEYIKILSIGYDRINPTDGGNRGVASWKDRYPIASERISACDDLRRYQQ